MPLRDQLLTALVLVFGLGIAIGGFTSIQSFFRTQAQQEFEGPARDFMAILGDAVDRHVELVGIAGAFFTAADEVSRWDFFEFARVGLPSYPGLRSLEWIPRVDGADRAALERRAWDDGLFDFRFVEYDAAGRPTDATPRAEHLPIFFVEPFDGNGHRLGMDLAAEPVSQQLNRARDTGSVVATRHVAPWHDPSKGLLFSVIVPVYRSSMPPSSIEERRAELAGYLRGVIHIGDLIRTVLPGVTGPPGLDVYVFDQDAGEDLRLLHFQPSALRREAPAPLSEAAALQGLSAVSEQLIAGWRWSIVVKPVASYFTKNVNIIAWCFVAFVVSFTLLLVQYLVSSQTRTQQIEHSVAERTAALENEIRERNRVETELRAAKTQAEVANRAKSEFLAMMSHELRTPLNAVIGFAEVMSVEFFGPLGADQYRRYATAIQMSGTHLLSLINDILDLSKIEANGFRLNEEVFHLSEAWQTVATIMEDNIAAAGLVFRTEVPPGLPRLRGDKRAVRQVLLNLLSNAVKFTPDGGTIRVSARLDRADGLEICVSDSGIGIAQEDLEKVLQPFRQVDSSWSRKYQGTGLGLPLAQRLVELHGGQLTLSSAPGDGTTARLTFPWHRVVAKEAAESDAAPPPGRSAAEPADQSASLHMA